MPIKYAVIALKATHVDSVVSQLKDLGLQRISDWLSAERNSLYGPRMEDWKPFHGQTVESLLHDEAQGEIFISETPLMDNLNQNLTNTDTLVDAEIEMFFLDVFALFSNWHKDLATRIDNLLADNPDRKCCLVIPYSLSEEVTHVLTKYGEVWASVVKGYLLGHFCPVVIRAEDMVNLKKFVPRLPRPGSLPNQVRGNAVDQTFGTGKKPNLGG
jgi:hypothetical protein